MMYTSTLGTAYGNAQSHPPPAPEEWVTNSSPPLGPKTETTRTLTGDRDCNPGLRFGPNPRPFCPPVCMGWADAGGRGQKNGSPRPLTPDLKGDRQPTTVGRKPTAGMQCRRSACPTAVGLHSARQRPAMPCDFRRKNTCFGRSAAVSPRNPRIFARGRSRILLGQSCHRGAPASPCQTPMESRFPPKNVKRTLKNAFRGEIRASLKRLGPVLTGPEGASIGSLRKHALDGGGHP